MKLFSKEKGFVFSALNAIFLIWIVTALVSVVSNLSHLLIRDNDYTYDEYKLLYCNMDYTTEDECKNDYEAHKLDIKSWDVDYKRSIFIGIANVVIVCGVMYLINKEKATNTKKK